MKKFITLATWLFLYASFSLMAADKINIAISAIPSNINPFFSTDANSQNINRLVHMALVDFNQQMKFECKACSSFTEKIEGNKQIFSFKLREDLTFADGTQVTAEDVKKSWEYFAKNQKIQSTFMGSFETIENVVVLDKFNLVITYSSFSLENLSNLAMLKIVKLKNPSNPSMDPLDVIGCGDYLLSKILPLEITVTPKDKSKMTFVFKVVKDETTLALKLINKEIDLSVASMSPRKVNWLKNKGTNLTVWQIPSGNFAFMGLNHKRDFFKDIKLRQAISLLIPRNDILKCKLKDTVVLSVGMFSPAFAEMYDVRPVEAYDLKRARQLITEAGYKKNTSGFLEKNGKVLELDWKVSNNKALKSYKTFWKKKDLKLMSPFKNGGHI